MLHPLPLSILAVAGFAVVTAAQELRDPLLGTVLAPDGTPLAGAKVEVLRAGGAGTRLLDLDYTRDFRPIAAVPTDKRGRFALQLPVGLSCRIVVDCAPHAVWLRNDCLPDDDLTVQLAEPAVFTGALTLADGEPAGANLRGWNRETRDEVLRGRTDAAGRFRFDRVAPGPLRVEITPDRAPAPEWFDVDLAAGQTAVHDVRLEAGVTLSGRVVDEQGRPIAGARVGEGWTLYRAATTDADGRYELPGFGSRGYPDVHCTAEGYVRQAVERPELRGAPITLDFRMPRGLATAGRVVDPHGAPLADVYVQAFAFDRGDPGGLFDLAAARTGADGSFHLRGLAPARDHVLIVRQDGRAMLVYALPEAGADGLAAVGDVVLPKARIVRGVLAGTAGEPLADTTVALHGYNADRHRFAPNGPLARKQPAQPHDEWGMLDRYVGRRSVRTDHRGRFAFGDVAAGEYRVVAFDARNRELAAAEGVVVGAAEDPAPVALSPR